MKFTLSWLKEHLETAAALDEVTTTLTRIGLEVESVDNPGAKLADFRVARVLSAEKHPQADKLQVLSVDAGDGPTQVVCGAPNARAGLVGVFGMPGATVPSNGMVLKVAEIRGVQSNGMMCSTRELELGEDHDGIIELPADAPIGTPYPDYAGLTDPVFDVAITPNRQDCMGVRGIARDLAAAGLGTLKPLAEVYRMASLVPVEGGGPAPDVRTDDAEGCPAFFAQGVSGVTNGEAPAWMRRKLTAIGQKPISVLVDITNFVSVDLGRPLHVYDTAKLAGGLVARKATDGEQVLALNGKTYTLDATMTAIADDAEVHDIGGIMGGEHSGVSATTTDVIIECAWFQPEGIARTGQKLGVTSDARQRFERGVDPAFLDAGLAIAAWLVTEHCGGTLSTVARSGTPPLTPKVVAYDPALAETLGGLAIDPAEQKAILERLGFVVDGGWNVTIPSWRRDIDGAPDLVEEVIRIVGIDSVPSAPLPRRAGVAVPTATPAQRIERKVRRFVAARGFHEAITWSFIAEREAVLFGAPPHVLANPISEDMKVMRTSLLPGLLTATRANFAHGRDSVRLFEIGRRYLGWTADGLSDERATLTMVRSLSDAGLGWRDAEQADWQTAKEDALAVIMAVLGFEAAKTLRVQPDAGTGYHPGRSGRLTRGKDALAAFGVLHPDIADHFKLRWPVAVVEVFLDRLSIKRGRRPGGFATTQLQPVRRDFAFWVEPSLAAQTLYWAIHGADKSIEDVTLFDVFEDEGSQRRSLGFRIRLQPGAKSFTDEDLKAVADKVVAAATKLGASLRG